MQKEIFVFIDFDGTIIPEDTTDVLFKAAGGFEENINLLKNGEINIFEYWKRFAKSLSAHFTPNTLKDYLHRFTPDRYFRSFIEMLDSYSVKYSIVSDNFKPIISQILQSNKLGYISFYVNDLEYQGNEFVPIFTRSSEGCEEMLAAVCKRNIILNQIPDGALVVYVGDGFSDYGAAEISDVIFAKDMLANYCSENRLPHHQYKSFFDVKFILEKLLSERKIHPRYQAQLARKKIFEME